jgi:hypothetical protein
MSGAPMRRTAALGIALAVVATGLLLVAAVGRRPLLYVTRDPQATTFERWFLGFFSNVGNALWWSAAGIAIVTALVLYATHRAEPGRFMLATALITLVLAIDDMFGVHDQWAYEEHIPKQLFFVAYGALAAGLFWRFRRELSRTWLTPLVLAVALYVCSSIFDGLSGDSDSDLRYLAEDGVKLLGVVCWAAWVAHTAFVRLRALAGAPDEDARSLPYD